MKKLLREVRQFFLVIILFGLPSEAVDGPNINVVEFNKMCKIYRLAMTPPRRPGLKEDVNFKSETEAILDEIEKLDVLTSTNGSYELISSKKEWEKLAEDPTKPPSLTEQKYTMWQTAPERGNIDPLKRGWGERYERPSLSTALTRASHKIKHLLAEGRILKSEILKFENEVDTNLLEAKKSLCQAAVGKVTLETKDKEFQCPGVSPTAGVTFSDDGQVKGCKAANGAGEAGLSLVNDIVCLCAQASTANAETFCGKSLSLGSTNFDSPTNGGTLWGHMQGECAQTGGKSTFGDPSPASIHRAIAEFQSLLGKGAYTVVIPSTGEKGILGRNAILGAYQVNANNPIVCNGAWAFSGNGNGMCVDYREKLNAGKQIPWVAKLEDAADHLRATQKSFEKVLHAYGLLKGLEREARLAFIEALNGGGTSAEEIRTEKKESTVNQLNGSSSQLAPQSAVSTTVSHGHLHSGPIVLLSLLAS